MQLLASEEYGLRCLLQVARAGGPDATPVSISAIAEAEGLSPQYTAKLMRELRIGNLVESVRGADGGYRLARPAREISVWSALQVLGGTFFSEAFCACHGGQQPQCVRSSDCSLRALWRTIQAALRDTLEGVSLADLQRDERSMLHWLDPSRLTPLTALPSPKEDPPMNEDTRSRIAALVQDHPVLLFMKGHRHMPQCGFSATVVQILDQLLPEYQTVNVLEDPEIREGVKAFSSWPTIPQLYVGGEFQGGCDIVIEMYESGELQRLLDKAAA